VRFNEISNVLRNKHACNIAARLEFGRDIGGNVVRPMFEGIERNHANGAVVLAR